MKLSIPIGVLVVPGLFVAAECRAAEPMAKAVTVLRNGKAVQIKKALVNEADLWLSSDDVPKANGFEPKPEGFCSADVCIPIPESSDWRQQRGNVDYFNITRFAEKVNQAVAVAESKATWSFGSVPQMESGVLFSGVAPDFALPDREGKTVRLSDFRGKKLLLLTWASW